MWTVYSITLNCHTGITCLQMEHAYTVQELSDQTLYMPNNPDGISEVAD